MRPRVRASAQLGTHRGRDLLAIESLQAVQGLAEFIRLSNKNRLHKQRATLSAMSPAPALNLSSRALSRLPCAEITD
jgi:hypothetical protein